MTDDIISQSVNRMFAEQVDRRALDRVEAGGWPAELWQMIEESGFADVLASDGDAAAGNWLDAFPVFRAIGYHRLPLPLSETIIARALVSRAGLEVAPGPMSVIQQTPGDGLELAMSGKKLEINGSAAGVPWARHAKVLVLSGTAGGRKIVAAIPTSAPGVTIEPSENVAREPRDTVLMNRTTSEAFAPVGVELAPDPITVCGALARAAMMAGAAESILAQSTQYANERIQFGRPIGKFQAIQQSLAVLAGEVVCADTAARAACHAAGALPSRFDVAVAKVRAGQAAGRAAAIGHQVHGAIGFTYEHTLHYATRRLWSWRTDFGTEAAWAEWLGRAAIRGGADRFWPSITARQFPES